MHRICEEVVWELVGIGCVAFVRLDMSPFVEQELRLCSYFMSSCFMYFDCSAEREGKEELQSWILNYSRRW